MQVNIHALSVCPGSALEGSNFQELYWQGAGETQKIKRWKKVWWYRWCWQQEFFAPAKYIDVKKRINKRLRFDPIIA